MTANPVLAMVEAQSELFGDMNQVTDITRRVLAAIPTMDWEQLMQTWDYAKDIGGHAWKIECACAAEALDRVSQQGVRGPDGRFVPDAQGTGRMAAARFVADERGVTERSVREDARIFRTFFGDRVENVFHTVPDPLDKCFYRAALYATDPRAALEMLAARKASDSRYSARDAQNDVDTQRAEERTATLQRQVVPLTALGRYPILYADPPWQYEGVTTTPSRRIERQYATLDHATLCALPVQEATQDSAVLFLWATNPLLPHALEAMRCWGFTYVTNLVWTKDRLGLGHWVRGQHELLLLGKRGEWPTPLDANMPRSIIDAPRREHSEKPTEAYEVIERMWPDMPRLELFARSSRPGWTAWGLEVGPWMEVPS